VGCVSHPGYRTFEVDHIVGIFTDILLATKSRVVHLLRLRNHEQVW
jgi:hypothetical protein